MSVAKGGLPIILVSWLTVFAIAGYAFYSKSHVSIGMTIFAAALGAFMLYFFRDPQRKIPNASGAIVSPADGRIIEINVVDEPFYIKEKALRIGVFLSIFDVHVNRFPMAGTVRFKHYRPGKFLAAFNKKAPIENEQTMVGIECKNGVRMAVCQIAGLIARRIVCDADAGKQFDTGQRFGMIRFGSRTDLYLPLGTALKVKKGDKVLGGATIIGEIP